MKPDGRCCGLGQLCSVRSRWRRSRELTLTAIKLTFASPVQPWMSANCPVATRSALYADINQPQPKPEQLRASDDQRCNMALTRRTFRGMPWRRACFNNF